MSHEKWLVPNIRRCSW